MNDKTLQDLMKIVSKLSRKKHSGEVSSVSYDEATELMEAAMYCIEANGNGIVASGEDVDILALYRAGYEKVVNKVKTAREKYNNLLLNFNDYKCINYRETILDGLSSFFLYYDAELRPQDHLLTMDYPLASWSMNGYSGNESGINLMTPFIDAIADEIKVLSCFSEQEVIDVINEASGYRPSLFLGNILEEVLYYEFKKLCARTKTADIDTTVKEGMNLLIEKSCVDNPDYFKNLINPIISKVKFYFNK